MKSWNVSIILAAAALSASEPAESSDAVPFSAQQVAAEGSVAIAYIQQLADADLKEFYLRCNRAALRGGLGSGEAALCSVGYETLLKRTFEGDFRALLDWRRAQHGARAAPPGPMHPGD